MGYRGKVVEQHRARELRADGWTMPEIAEELGVARSSVSVWVRDVPYVPRRQRSASVPRRPNALQRRKAEEIERLLAEGRERIGELSEREFLIAGVMLYAGEGDKTDGRVGLANTDPRMIAFFVAWLRHFFVIDERRLRLRLYLHAGLDLDAAETFWVSLTRIPRQQFHNAYRAVPDPSIRTTKHPMGCPKLYYSCARTHRAVMGLVTSLLTLNVHSGVAQLAEHATVNRVVEGSSPSPGARTHDRGR